MSGENTISLGGLGVEAVASAAGLPPRYEGRGELGRGGMGTVRRVYDRELDREVAMKILDAQRGTDEASRRRFAEEARLVAGLQHPGIVGVYDHGELDDGCLWFTMPIVQGATFADIVAELHRDSGGQRWRTSRSGWTFLRVLDAFRDIALAVAFAHDRGVVHRDLKPANVMVGAFGQVQVMDWGVARRGGGGPAPAGVSGTPAYMAPEQARGEIEAEGPWCDVYALGAMLYEVLSGVPPYAGDAMASLFALRRGPPAPLRERVGPEHPPLPEDLVALVELAMARDPAERPRNAAQVARAITAWRDGELRRERALAALAAARPAHERGRALREEASALRHAAVLALAGVEPHDPVARKVGAWALEDRAAELEVEAGLEETRWEQGVRGALELDPEQLDAHRELAHAYRSRADAALTRRDMVAAARWEALVRAHDRGEHADWLSGDGTLGLAASARHATATISRFVVHQRQLRPEVVCTVRLPLDGLRLTAGSYVARVEAPGREPVALPFTIARGAHASWTRPGEARARPVRLPLQGELDAGVVWVGAGWAWLGGDRDAVDALPRRRWWVDDLLVQRAPVTCRDYLVFLDDLAAQGRMEEALARAPAEVSTTTASRHVQVTWDGERFALGREGDGTPLCHDWPITNVSWHDAQAYARWWSARTGRRWRLPHDHEWEKAARGADGRAWPWGDHFDPTWACTVHSQRERAGRVAVGSFADDRSPYGVVEMAGNVREWCVNGYEREGPGDGGLLVVEPNTSGDGMLLVKGGAWFSSPDHARLASRFAAPADSRLVVLGFRLVSSVSEGAR